jgi:kumamolisin
MRSGTVKVKTELATWQAFNVPFAEAIRSWGIRGRLPGGPACTDEQLRCVMNIPEGYQRLEGSERHPARNARLLGPADAAETFSVTIVLRRRLDGPPVPNFEWFAATPPRDRHRMPIDEFASKYGASPEDIDRVVAFARSKELRIVETNAARRTVVVSGTVAQMNEAFGVELGRYQVDVTRGRPARPHTETYRGRDGFIHVPAGLAPLIVGVFGLDNRRITRRSNAGDPPDTTTTTVPQVTQLYNFPTNSAAGQTIAILSEGGYATSDIQKYFSALPAGYTMPTIIDITVDASNGSPDIETTQDICIAASAAPGANIAVYFTTGTQSGWTDLIARVIHPDPGDPVCSVLSSSWFIAGGDDPAGLAYYGVTTAFLNAVDTALQDAAMQDVTVCAVSGDEGAESYVPDGKAHVVFPASDPWALGCGGTTIGNISGLSFDEYVWNDSFVIGGVPVSGATGGGVSAYFPLPSYQQSANVPVSLNNGNAGRGVPDVAANASWNSGYYPIYCENAAAFGYPNPYNGNGTSAAAPLYAGLIAVLSAALGKPVGFLNPTLYMLSSSVCRDISPPPGPTNNSLNGVTGYPAGPGWDACTGWGSIDGTALLLGLMIDIGSLASIAAQ